MSKVRKLNAKKNTLTKQSTLTNYSVRGGTPKASDNMSEEAASSEGELGNANADAILAALSSMKTEFNSRFDGVMMAIENMKKEMKECNERVSQAEIRISSTEDEVTNLQAKVKSLELNNKTLEDKLLDLETRSRLNNLRIVNLPEGAEGSDPVSFLEKWIPEALDAAALRPAVVLERAHRIGAMRDAKAPPRTLIMRFLNYKDKEAVTAAARAKKDIRYKDQQVRFYPDLAAGLHRLRKQFDPVRQELRNLGIRHGVIHPARLLVTHNGRTYTFKTPTEAQEFIKNIQKDAGGS